MGEDVGNYWMAQGKERILTSERGSFRSHYAESSLRKKLWTCHKTDK
jgi:hypothetical protein